MGWMYYYDYYFLILVVPAMLIALWAQIKVKTTFASQSKRLSSRGLTGAQAAMRAARSRRVIWVTSRIPINEPRFYPGLPGAAARFLAWR